MPSRQRCRSEAVRLVSRAVEAGRLKVDFTPTGSLEERTAELQALAPVQALAVEAALLGDD